MHYFCLLYLCLILFHPIFPSCLQGHIIHILHWSFLLILDLLLYLMFFHYILFHLLLICVSTQYFWKYHLFLMSLKYLNNLYSRFCLKQIMVFLLWFHFYSYRQRSYNSMCYLDLGLQKKYLLNVHNLLVLGLRRTLVYPLHL